MQHTDVIDSSAQVVVDATLIARIQEQDRLIQSLRAKLATPNPDSVSDLLRALRLRRIGLFHIGPGDAQDLFPELADAYGPKMASALLQHLHSLDRMRMPGALRAMVRKGFTKALNP
ncbi:hypothetical protein [Achromobacter spanius]|uniref:hypothetical protein n=1 Tax=Achromobacter spanius TaxID=217203 RepID=UPI003827CA71